MIGHGSAGTIGTGDGQTLVNPERYISTWNKGRWENVVRRLGTKQYPILTILSCHTGAGADGAELLYMLAGVTGKPVRARTGFTCCGNGIIFEPGSTWQVAFPNQLPHPIEAPNAHVKTINTFEYKEQSGHQSVPLDSIVGVTIHNVLPDALGLVKASVRKQLSDIDAQDLIHLMGSGRFDAECRPLAIVTALLEVSFKDHTNQSQVRWYNVYNDRAVEDQSFPGILRFVSPSFSAALQH